jgi:acetyl esterase
MAALDDTEAPLASSAAVAQSRPRPTDRAMSAAFGAMLRLPKPALRRLAGPPKRNDRGDVLDQQTQAALRVTELLRFPKAYEQTPAEARDAFDRQVRLVDPSPPSVAHVEQCFCDGPTRRVPLRVYRPSSPQELPVLVYLHGGGYVIGSLDSHDGVCRRLAVGAQCIVVAVDYCRAPEHPFPASVDEAVAAFEWALEHASTFGGDPGRVAIGGDSAGGGLAAVVCHQQRDAGRPQPAAQLLIYPATDQTRSMPSHRLFSSGYYLDAPLKDWFVSHHLGGAEHERDPRASPLFAERFDGLPPALLVIAGFDPLRDEDEAYADKLRAAGISVDQVAAPSLIHGFVNMAMVDAAARATERFVRAAHDVLRG